MKPYNNLMFPVGTVLNADLNSKAEQLYQCVGYAIQVVFTGTPTGTFKLQGSCDPYGSGDPSFPKNWSDIADSSHAVSAAGDFLWNVFYVEYNWVRLVYADGSSGSSTAVLASARINAKT